MRVAGRVTTASRFRGEGDRSERWILQPGPERGARRGSKAQRKMKTDVVSLDWKPTAVSSGKLLWNTSKNFQLCASSFSPLASSFSLFLRRVAAWPQKTSIFRWVIPEGFTSAASTARFPRRESHFFRLFIRSIPILSLCSNPLRASLLPVMPDGTINTRVRTHYSKANKC